MPIKTIINTEWKYRGFEAVILENKQIRMVVLPELVAKIWELTNKKSDTDLLWKNPRLPLRAVSHGASYDNNFTGGWDELFPNDEPLTLNGETYPDHGELWSQPWQWEIEESSADRGSMHLWCHSSVLNVRVDKWISLQKESAVIRFRHRIQNFGSGPIDFLWKLHPALSISPHHRIDLPPCTILRVDEAWSGLIGEERFAWPSGKGKNGGMADLRRVPGAESNVLEFVYATELTDGWCALTDASSGVGFGMRFPKEIFRSVWLFLSYGGWRGYYTAIIEPCTAYPKELDRAIAQGTCSHLAGGGVMECEVEAVVFDGLKAVRNIREGGEVIGD